MTPGFLNAWGERKYWRDSHQGRAARASDWPMVRQVDASASGPPLDGPPRPERGSSQPRRGLHEFHAVQPL